MSNARKLAAMEAEVSGLQSLSAETAVSGKNAVCDIHRVIVAVAEKQLAHGGEICALEEEMQRVREAMAGIGRSLGQQEGEWQAVIGDLCKKVNQERNDVSQLKEVLRILETKHEQLQAMVARQGDELAETRQWNLELSSGIKQLEEENRRLRESSEGPTCSGRGWSAKCSCSPAGGDRCGRIEGER
jgi:chromosome segregation ATPase